MPIVPIRDAQESHRAAPAVVTPYPDGPLILRGSFVITDVEGREIDPGRRTVALCRCGRSALKPFCDGSHLSGFRATGGDERPPRGRRTPQAAVAVGGDGEPAPRVPDPA
jgi:CDGSH-type Zn-finger protein